MADLEKIVRPFSSERVFTARVQPPDPPAVPDDPEESSLTIEGKAEARYQEDPPPYSIALEVEWKEDPDQRIETTVRVENEQDPEQYVDVRRIDQMEIVNTVTRDRIKLRPFENEES